MPEEIWMVRHYYYDGNGRHDQDDVLFEWTSEKAFDHLKKWYKELPDYDWETGGEGFKILIRKEGQYAYDYYYIQNMKPGEEID